jgi:hypothetical protein
MLLGRVVGVGQKNRRISPEPFPGPVSDLVQVRCNGLRVSVSECTTGGNVGLQPLVRPEIPAVTRARLAWIQQNHLRADTITNASARLVDVHVHAALPVTKALGSTEFASADGLRFVVPVRSVHASANPRYFGRGKGVTYINYTSAGLRGYWGAAHLSRSDSGIDRLRALPKIRRLGWAGCLAPPPDDVVT